MLQIYKTIEEGAIPTLSKITEMEKGSWIHMVSPTENEIKKVSDTLHLPIDFLNAALDEEERPRLDYEEGFNLVLIDIPVISTDNNSGMYSTIPLGIIVGQDHIVTVCLKDSSLMNDFVNHRIKQFFTYKKTRFLLQILYRNASYYLNYLREIDKRSNLIEIELHRSTKNKELLQLLALEKSLVYFSTSLKSNEVVIERIIKVTSIRMFPEDQDLLDDVIIENKQAIEMAYIYSSILSGTMDAFASVISNNLNIVMKLLTSITIVLSVPTMIASFLGMNVHVPFADNTYGFIIVVLFSFLFSGILGLIMFKKNLF